MEIYSDVPAEQDLLNRKPFAAQIAKRLVSGFSNEHDSVVLGLNGPWGSGKSTLLSYLKKAIIEHCEEKKIEYLIYEFNPWMFSGQEALQREFLEGLLHELKDHFKSISSFKKWAEKNLHYIRVVKWIPKYGEAIHDIIEKTVAGLEPFSTTKEIKQKVDEVLVNGKTRLYIFLDDLDRLSPDETVEIFKLVKLNTNFKNTVFIAAYDRVVVEHALRHKYGDSSKRYLEKIIQIDFKIPEILPEKSQSLFIEELRKFFQRENIDYDVDSFVEIWKKAELYKIICSIRDVYRFLNAISFTLPSIYQDIHITDFLILEVIRVFDYETYELLYQEMAAKQNMPQWVLIESKKQKEFADKMQPIINVLLPSTSEHSRKRESDKRFADSAFVERYFSLQISSYDISEKEFKDYLESNNKKEILLNAANHERLNSFFERLEKISANTKNDFFNYEEIFTSILDLLEDDVLQRKWCNKAFFSIGQVMRNTPDYFKLAEIFIECLTQDLSRLSFSWYLFSHWTLEDLEKTRKTEKPETQRFFDKKMKLLEISQQKYHDNWFGYIMHPSVWKKPQYAVPIFLSYYAKNRFDDYIGAMEKTLESANAVIELTKMLVMFIDDDGKPHRYSGERYLSILPPPLDTLYITQLKGTLATLPDGRDRLLVEFMHQALKEKSS